MMYEQALKVPIDAGAKLLRFWRLPHAEALHVEAKNPEGVGGWHCISRGDAGAMLAAGRAFSLSAGDVARLVKGETSTGRNR